MTVVMNNDSVVAAATMASTSSESQAEQPQSAQPKSMEDFKVILSFLRKHNLGETEGILKSEISKRIRKEPQQQQPTLNSKKARGISKRGAPLLVAIGPRRIGTYTIEWQHQWA